MYSIELQKSRLNIRENLDFPFLLDELGIKVYPGNKIFSIYKKETVPSLQINVQKNIFYCFSTGKGGDIVRFYMDYCKVDYVKALDDLDDIYIRQDMLDIKKENTKILNSEKWKAKFSKKISLRNTGIQMRVYDYIINTLLEKGLPQDIKKYLLSSKRKLTTQTITKFKIRGIYNINVLKQWLVVKFSLKELQIAGVMNERNNLVFYYNKIIIPYIKNGKPIYLRCHHLPDDNKNIPKYMGLKGLTARRIFNVDVLKNMKKADKLYLCEGEFDTMIADQAGLNAIGFPGVTNIPFNELKKLDIGQYKLYLAFDNDDAGDKAANLFVNELGIECKRIKLNNTKDLTEDYNGK